MLYSHFLHFCLMSSSDPGSHPAHHITFSCRISLDSSWLWHFLRLSSFLMTLTVPRSTGQVFCRLPLHGICLMYFSWVMGFGEEEKRGEVSLVSFYQGHILTWYITADTDLDHLDEGVGHVLPLSDSPPQSLPLHTALFGRKRAQLMFWGWGCMVLLFEGEICM